MRTHVYKAEKKKQLSPWWRGVGCLMIIIIFALSFAASSWFLERMTDPNPETRLVLPGQLAVMNGGLRSMQSQLKNRFTWFGLGRYIAPAGLAFLIGMMCYGVIEAAYAWVRGDINDPRDERRWRPDSRKSRNVRKCR